jgi:hypothetical protein
MYSLKHRGALTFSLLSALTASLAGCSGDGGSVSPPGNVPSEPPKSPAAVSSVSDAETFRIQKYIDSRYSAADVLHTFRTARGQQIDCVDAYAQPGMKHPAMRGKTIATPPNHASPAPSVTDSAIEPLFGGSDEDGNDRACPSGAVAIAHLDAETIKNAGGLRAYMGHRPQGLKPGPIATPDSHASNYAHVEGSPSQPPPNMHGASVTFSVHKPSTSSSSDHSLSQLWFSSGSAHYWDAGGCTTGATGTCYQTLETGWTVDSQLNGDNAPHLFIFTTWDGYADGAYNAAMAYNYKNGVYDSFAPWVAYPGAPYTVGQPLTYNAVGAVPKEITLEWFSDFGAPDWWLYVNGVPIGYYHSTLFSGSMADPNGWGNHLFVGGEVYAGPSGTDTAEMGTGNPAEYGYPLAGYQRNVQYAGRTQGLGYWAPLLLTSWYVPYPSCYDEVMTGGQVGWGTYFFFGGTSMSSEWWAFKPGCTPNFH